MKLIWFLFPALLGAQCSTIPQVQGDGPRSSCVDRTVTLTGVVTASYPGMQGFFLQDPAGDGRPETSDGVFVFGSANNLPASGTIVRVSGRLVEFARSGNPGSVTEVDLRNGGSVEATGTAPLPRPVVLDPQSTDPEALERYEGMLVAYPSSVVISPSTRFGEYLTLRTDRMPPPVRLFPTTFRSAVPLMIDQAGGIYRKNTSVFDLVPDLTGVLHYDFGTYRLEPLADYLVSEGGLAPTAAPSAPGFLRAAFMNCQRLVRQLTAQALELKLAKLALAIREQLGSPDLVAVAEVEDLELLEALGTRAGNYRAVLLKGCDFGNISVGLLYNPDRVRRLAEFQLQTEAPEFRNGRCMLPDGRTFTQYLFDRPPLVVDMAVGQTVITVVVNHWRSRIGGNEPERIASAEYLADQLKELGRENVIVLGDFNDTEDSPSVLTLAERAGFTNLTWQVPEANRYSLLFEGVSQALDHILLSPSLTPMVRSHGYAHFNADFPALLADRADTAVRAADHDAPYVVFE